MKADFLPLGRPVSKLFFGTATRSLIMGDYENSMALLDYAAASGINAFDCARGYGNAEAVLGRWMQERHNRSEVVILTKCGNVSPDGTVKVNREVIEKELAESLHTLQTDYIDIYLLHRDDPDTPLPEILETLNRAEKKEKLKPLVYLTGPTSAYRKPMNVPGKMVWKVFLYPARITDWRGRWLTPGVADVSPYRVRRMQRRERGMPPRRCLSSPIQALAEDF